MTRSFTGWGRPTAQATREFVGLVTGPGLEQTALEQTRADMDATVATETQTALDQTRADLDATVATETQTTLTLTEATLEAT